MLPDRVSNPGPLTYESGVLPIALRGPALPWTYNNNTTPDKDLPNDSQTNIHSNNVPRHDSSPNNKHPQSVSHPKPYPSTRTTVFNIYVFPE